jgi:hypothetical protein
MVPMKIKRWNGFSVTNDSQSEAKLTYIRLNRQTPRPPRDAACRDAAVLRRLIPVMPPDYHMPQTMPVHPKIVPSDFRIVPAAGGFRQTDFWFLKSTC